MRAKPLGTLVAAAILAGCAEYGRTMSEVDRTGMGMKDFAWVRMEVWGMT